MANLDTTSAVEESKESDEDDSKIPALNDNTIYDLNIEKILRDETYIPDIRLDMSVELLELLKKAKAPLYLYKEIFKWARKCTEKVPEFFIQKPYNKEYVVSQLEHNFNIDLKPKSIAVTLPSKKRVDIVVHDFQKCLFSLLSDKDMMHSNNLLLDSDCPWRKKTIPSGFADIDSGSLWSNGWALYCDPEKKEVLCP